MIRAIFISLTLLLGSTPLLANMANWSDKTVCRLLNQNPTDAYQQEARRRNLNCQVDVPQSTKPKSSLTTSAVNSCRLEQGHAYIFNDANNGCFKPNISNATERYKRSRRKDARAYPAYFRLQQQAASIDLPKQYHIFENLQPLYEQTLFVTYPTCEKTAPLARWQNRDLQPVFLPKKVVADTKSGYGGGKLNELINPPAEKNLPIGMACQGGNVTACDRIVEVLMEGAKNNKLTFDRKYNWRHQTAYMTNNHLLYPHLVMYSYAIPRSTIWSEKVHKNIGKWLARVIKDADEYIYYGFEPGNADGSVARVDIANHDTIQAATRMAYGLLWQDKERFIEGLNIYKYRLETVREDGSMPSETRRGVMTLFYQNTAVRDLIRLAEMAQAAGFDLYGYKNKRGQDIHDVAKFVVDSTVDESLIRTYAKERFVEGFPEYWPDFNRDENWLGNQGAWYHFYKKRFPDSELVTKVENDDTGLLYLYTYDRIEDMAHPGDPPGNVYCVVEDAQILDKQTAQKQFIASPGKGVWDMAIRHLQLQGSQIKARVNISTFIKQLAAVRNMDFVVTVDQQNPQTGSVYLYKGVSNNGDLDDKGERFSFAIEPALAEQVEQQCGQSLLQEDGKYYPSFTIGEALQGIKRGSELAGLSAASDCMIKTLNLYSYKEMGDYLRFMGLALHNRSEQGFVDSNQEDVAILLGIKDLAIPLSAF